MRRVWPTSLAPGAMGGVRAVTALPSAAELANLDPAQVRSVVLAGPASKATLLDALAIGLALPVWFGRNWDALDELLRAPEPPDDRAIVIVWHDPDRLPKADREAAEAVFTTAVTARREAGSRPLVVLVAATTGMEPMKERRAMLPPAASVPDAVRRIGRVHHVALIVRSIDDAISFWCDLMGLELESVLDVADDRVRIAFLAVGESKIELVEPMDETTGVSRYLESKGEGFHHVCFEVRDLAETLLRLTIDGLVLIDSTPRRGAAGPVAFIHPRSCHGILVELIEAPGGPAWQQLGLTTR